ncbi:restriction endonuclease subunit S [Enterococcus faecium]|uniref:restriction endonuclease subunit S n=1 Tax=Enterococcus faecium TaxID=1352 RepID=UPI0023B34767|nr:restriction endonuclease subunit S [Enterococcus faecium]
MSNDTQPEIRFPGFTEDWEQRELSDISTKVQTKNKDREFTETLTNSAEFGIISQNDFFDKEISNKNNIDGYYVVKPNDFVYNPRISNFAPVGPIKRNKLGRTGVMSPLYYVFSTNNIDNQYLETYFSTSYWHKFMKLNGDSGARADRFAIRDSVFVKMPIPYPSREEQEKIGQFFEVLSNAIDLQQRKLDLLKETKKGFLQKMFPKNGAKVPEIRFPGFTEDWEERKFSDFTKLSQGLQIAISDRFTEAGPNKEFYITNEFLNPNNTKKYYIENPSKNVIANKNDILMTRTGNTGKVVTNTKGAFHNNFFKIDYDPQKISKLFLYFLLTSIPIQKEILIRAGTSTIPDLNHKDFYNIKVYLPIFEEQQKIGNFFKQLDDTIALHQRKLDLLKETKKGFLQKMFV